MDNENNKPKIAVALQYEKGEQAPKIIATGKGYLADKIIEKAKDMRTASLLTHCPILK